jgi:butyrate kinase
MLIINPGSTSTKIAVFEDENNVYEKTLRHSVEELSPYTTVASQKDFRMQVILKCLVEDKISQEFDIIVGRGGMLRPIEAGAYEVNDRMENDLLSAQYGEHACSLGALVGRPLAEKFGCKIIIADPVVTDEMQDIARVSGHPMFPRISTFHCLNQKAIARRYAQEAGIPYEHLNLIIAHIGGGVSVSAHGKGRTIDTNNALGFGPFSPERSGTLPSAFLVKLCFSGEYTQEELLKLCNGKGGLIAHLNTNSGIEVEQMIANGDKHAELVWNAMAYNIAKEIGALATVFNGKVDAILITGGIAYGKDFVNYISRMVHFIAPVRVYPGEDELTALAKHGIRVLNGEKLKTY